ncbi:MAG: UvrB/UvrC motif-containing protein [Treponema sp.]|nr:UvrB/UvrC motif-containing protein [Treponema sp.]
MLCDICHQREAIVFIEQVGSEAKKKVCLCLQCAEEKGFSPNDKDLEKSVGTIIQELFTKNASKGISRTCPVCGQSLTLLLKNNRLGCPECYEIFKDEIKKQMKQNGISGTYTGSMPHRLRNFRSILTDRIDLQTKLMASIEKEDYEKAALYRDFLKALEKAAVSKDEDDAVHQEGLSGGTV